MRTGHTSDEPHGIMDILLANEPKIDDMMIPPRGEYSVNAGVNQRNLRGRRQTTPPKQPSRNIKEALLVNQPMLDGNLPLPPRDSHLHTTEGFDPN